MNKLTTILLSILLTLSAWGQIDVIETHDSQNQVTSLDSKNYLLYHGGQGTYYYAIKSTHESDKTKIILSLGTQDQVLSSLTNLRNAIETPQKAFTLLGYDFTTDVRGDAHYAIITSSQIRQSSGIYYMTLSAIDKAITIFKPQSQPVVQEVEVLNVVEDDVETEEIEINTEDDKTGKIIQAPVEIEEEEDDNVVFVIVEDKPEFPGGDQALMRFIADTIRYPVIAQENGIQGRVICQFVVNKDGSITDITVVRSVEPSLDKEAIRVIQNMPKWKPGKQRGKAVRVKFTLPIVFRLS